MRGGRDRRGAQKEPFLSAKARSVPEGAQQMAGRGRRFLAARRAGRQDSGARRTCVPLRALRAPIAPQNLAPQSLARLPPQLQLPGLRTGPFIRPRESRGPSPAALGRNSLDKPRSFGACFPCRMKGSDWALNGLESTFIQ